MRAVTCGLLVIGLVMATGCRKPDAQKAEAQQPAPAIHAQTVPVVEQPMPAYLTLTGTLRASQESEVAADASGKVTQTFVERGQRVKQGDAIVVLDSRGASITASAAAAQTNLARAQLEQAQKECDRVKSLFQSGAISQAEYDRTTSQCQTTQFSAAAAAAQQQNAQKIVGDAIIRAPFTGLIGERYANVGQYVQPSTRVVSLYNPDPLRLELTVPEANVAAVKPGLPVRFTVSSYADRTFTCAVKFVSPHIRPSTRDLVVEALCPNADESLKPGMFAVAQLEVGDKTLPVVPKSALRRDETSARVLVIVDKHAQERLVQVGPEKDGLVGILVGVKPGDSVVKDLAADVRDGAQVQ